MRLWNKIAIGVLLVVLCAVGGVFWLGAPKKQSLPAAPPPQGEPSLQPLVLQGRSYCSLTIPVPAAVPGEVDEICVSIGQAVKKDDVLLKLKLTVNDATAMAARLNKGPALSAQEMNLKQQAIKLQQLERNIAEAKQLEALGMASRNTLIDLLDQQRMAVSQMELTQVNLNDARRAAADDIAILEKALGQRLHFGSKPTHALVLAPQDGYVITIDPAVRKGALAGGVLMTLGDMDPMIIRGQVHESELSRLQNAQNATITMDGGKGESFQAVLSRLSWAAQDGNLAAPAYYLFELVVANPDNKIRDGFKVQVTLSPAPAAAPAPAAPAAPAPAPAAAAAPAVQAPAQGPAVQAPAQGPAKAPAKAQPSGATQTPAPATAPAP